MDHSGLYIFFIIQLMFVITVVLVVPSSPPLSVKGIKVTSKTATNNDNKPPGPDKGNTATENDDLGKILGGVFGGIFGLLLIGGLLYWAYQRYYSKSGGRFENSGPEQPGRIRRFGRGLGSAGRGLGRGLYYAGKKVGGGLGYAYRAVRGTRERPNSDQGAVGATKDGQLLFQDAYLNSQGLPLPLPPRNNSKGMPYPVAPPRQREEVANV